MRYILVSRLAVGALVAVASAAPTVIEPTLIQPRNIVDQISDAYDFVIVGGGLAGLVLGGRLSEDANHTVLVLEAGQTGDAYRSQIDVPGNAYYKSLWPTPLNWDFKTVPQPGANNTQCEWPRGKTLGGSSAINGLYLNRPGEVEINAWQSMLGDMDGADNWSWDSFFDAMKKSETFTPPSSAIAQEGGIAWDAASHGTNGPIHYSYPGYAFPLTSQWMSAAASAGVADVTDPYGGANWGTYVSTSAINPANWTRSYSKTGYLDPLPPRSNYDVFANAHVTRILFDSNTGNLTANAVEYSTDGGATKSTVKVKKEVILAGGSVGSPAVLLYSGVGPKDVLTNAGVQVISELPGVGQHLQDHLSVSLQWSTDDDTAGSLYADDATKKDDPAFLSFVNDAIAYVNTSALFGAGAGGLQSSINGQISNFVPTASSDSSVITGFKAIYKTTVNTIMGSPLGIIELLIGNNLDGSVRIGASLQHPLSHGQIYINSANGINDPIIDPGYLNHPADVQILREGLKLARRIGSTGPLAGALKKETWPGTDNVQTDAEWEDWLRANVFTEFHPSSTCAMLPKEQGGVVDANLKVYGLSNVRVADASVPPISFSAHLMGSTYGLAEQASDIIRRHYNIKGPTKSHHTNSTANATTTVSDTPAKAGTSTNGTASSNGDGKTNNAATSIIKIWPIVLAVIASVGMQTLTL